MSNGRDAASVRLVLRSSFTVTRFPGSKNEAARSDRQTGPPEGELRTIRSADVTAERIVPLFGVVFWM